MTLPEPLDKTRPVAIKGVSTRRDWYCPACGRYLTTYVAMTAAPSHRCPVTKRFQHYKEQTK